ncbi:alpha-2,3-sialyltransferase, partial [Campylobacter jejuni]|nr:alpha-2,3-sialyltransferase [Campylobacter jejuni]
LIKSSKKSYFYLFKSLITLAYFSKKYKINPEYTTDYETLKKYKNSFSFKVGSQFINAHKNWYKGGYIKFIFKDIPRLKREFDNKKYKL